MSDISRSGAFGDHAPNIKWIAVELSSDAARHEINKTCLVSRRGEGYLMTREFACSSAQARENVIPILIKGSFAGRLTSVNLAQALGTIIGIMGSCSNTDSGITCFTPTF
jgi:hypothetical protein